jgi:hypothetical protein
MDLKDWNFMRILRLGIGLWLGYSAIAEQQLFLGLFSGIFLVQGIFNLGCGTQGCGVPKQKNTPEINNSEVTYEEIK